MGQCFVQGGLPVPQRFQTDLPPPGVPEGAVGGAGRRPREGLTGGGADPVRIGADLPEHLASQFVPAGLARTCGVEDTVRALLPGELCAEYRDASGDVRTPRGLTALVV